MFGVSIYIKNKKMADSQQDITILENRERLRRMNWSVLVRYVMIIAIILLTLLGDLIGFNFDIRGIFVVTTVIFIFNITSSFVYTHINYPRFWPYFGIFLDMIIITAIVHFTGGIESIFLPLYLLQIVGTNVHFSRIAGPMNFVFGGILFILLVIFEQRGILPHINSNIFPVYFYQNKIYLWLTTTTMVSLMGISAYRSGYVVRSLQAVETQLFKVNDELAKSNLTISKANRRLKEVDQMKTEFISVASHQLRTPLSAIKWILKMIIDGDMGALNKDQKELLIKGYQSNERMIMLINDLLNVSRIEEGRFEYRFIRMQIEEVVDKVIEETISEIKNRRIRFNYNKPTKPLPKVSIDPQKMHLVLQNLIDNALKYTPSKGIIVINLELHGNYIIFSVRDNGVGIPSYQRDKIFSKFFRADNVIRMQTEGSGLGLFIVKNIIENHNGEAWFESEEGKGSCFFFSLPCEADEEKTTPTKFEEFMKKI